MSNQLLQLSRPVLASVWTFDLDRKEQISRSLKGSKVSLLLGECESKSESVVEIGIEK